MLLPTFLAAIPDHRRPQGRLYGLEHLLLFSILAILSDATSYRKIQRFIEARLSQLNALCGLHWKRAPAHTAIRYTLQGLNPADVEVAFRGHAAVLDGPRDGLAGIALDGNTLRGSFDRFQDQKALQVLSALTTDRTLILGHVLIGAAGKSHEIPAAQPLINELGLSGRLFTRDALHCQKKTVESVMATGNHLIVQVKANQPTLFQPLTETYPAQPPQDRHHTHEIGRHNRIERRLTRTWSLPLGTGTEDWHDHFCTLVEIQRHTEVFDTRKKDWVLRQETAHYVSTVTLSAADAAQAVRAHWGIENRLHYVRDVTLGEDASRIRRNPGLFALLRRFALNLLRFNGVTNISLGLYDNALNFDRLVAYQGL